MVIKFANSGAIVFEQVIIADGSGNALLPYISPQNAMVGSYNIYAVANDPPLTKFKDFMITRRRRQNPVKFNKGANEMEPSKGINTLLQVELPRRVAMKFSDDFNIP